MLQASPQKIDLHRLLAHFSLQGDNPILIRTAPAWSGEGLGAELAQPRRQRYNSLGFTSLARATSATEAPNSSRRTAASLNSRVNFRRDKPMTQFSIR